KITVSLASRRASRSRQDENAECYRRSADSDRRDHGITRCSDDRYSIVKFVRDVGLAAVRRECDADGAVANGDRRGHSVGRRVYDRYAIVYVRYIELAAVRRHRDAGGSEADV